VYAIDMYDYPFENYLVIVHSYIKFS
jgi:hypothetical protein